MNKYLYLVIVLVFHFSAIGQSLVLKNYTTTNGLPSNYIFNIMEDQGGYLWFATDCGAVRFDGSKFERILDSAMVYRVCEISKGVLWFCTFEHGAIAVDSKSLSVNHTIIPRFKESVFDIREDGYNRMLLRTLNGVEVHTKNDTLIYRDSINQTPSNLLLPAVRNQHIFRANGGLYSINSYYDSITISSVKTDNALDIIVKNQANIYFLGDSFNSGRHFLTLSGIARIGLTNDKFTLTDFYNIKGATSFCWWNDRLIVGTKDNGLRLIQEKNESPINIDHGLKNNYVTSVYKDSHNQLWVGTFGGGIHLISEKKVKPIYGITSSIQVVEIDRNGIIYAGTPEGLHILYRKEQIKPINEPDFKQNVRSIALGENDKLYIGTYLSLIEPATNKGFHRSERIYFQGNGVSGIVPAKNGQVWISTYGSGILLISAENQIVETYDCLPTKMINRLFRTGGSIWGTSGKGLFQIANGKWAAYSIQQGLPDSNPNVVFQDSDSTIWVGSAKGISRYNPLTSRFVPITKGFEGTRVVQIFRDREQRFWVLSNTHLHLFENEKMVALHSIDILPSNDYTLNDAKYNPVNNELVMATSNGLLSLNLSLTHKEKTIPLLYMERIIADTLAINFNDSSIVLGPNQTSLKINIGIHYTLDTKDVTWMSYLEGIDNGWSEPTSNFELNYPRLPYGTVKLWAKSINPDGLESQPQLLLSAYIKKPLYRRWYSIIIESFLLLTALVLLVKYFTLRKIKKRMRELEVRQKIHTERQRIARDLHDNVGSQLTYLITNLDQLSNEGNIKAKELSSFGRSAIGQLRETIWAIHSDYTDIDDFVDGIRKMCYQYLKSINIDCSIESALKKNIKLTPIQTLNLYRIAQESVTNIIKHSKATQVKIEVLVDTDFTMLIMDNGIGMQENSNNGYGIKNIKNRVAEIGANIMVDAKDGLGTAIRVSFPINKN